MHRPLQHLAELVARAGADLLDARAALAEEDRALAVALDVDGLLDAHAAVGPVFPLVGLDRGLVGQFLVELQEDLLARDLGRQQAQRQIGRLVLGIEERAFRQRRGQCRKNVLHPVLLQRTHHERPLEGQTGVELGRERQQFFTRHQIDLVQDHEAGRTLLLEPLDDRLGLGPDAALGIDHQRYKVGVGGTLPGGGDHGALEPALGDAENARRVDQHELRARAVRQIGHGNADHPHARGLHLGRDDADLRADQGVDQGRLAGVGCADDGGKARARARRGHCLANCSRSALAAALSASRLVWPLPRTAGKAPTLTSTKKTGSCSEPSRPTWR